jgi:hypothetical protein
MTKQLLYRSTAAGGQIVHIVRRLLIHA